MVDLVDRPKSQLSAAQQQPIIGIAPFPLSHLRTGPACQALLLPRNLIVVRARMQGGHGAASYGDSAFVCTGDVTNAAFVRGGRAGCGHVRGVATRSYRWGGDGPCTRGVGGALAAAPLSVSGMGGRRELGGVGGGVRRAWIFG